MVDQNFDVLSIGYVDFKAENIETLNYYKGDFADEAMYFDLASITKPFTLSFAYFKDPSVFNKRNKLLLNHRGGLPAWARLGRSTWKQMLLDYPIIESKTVYSDLGALRLMLDIEGNLARPFKNYVQDCWNKEVLFWKDIANPSLCVDSGSGTQGKVHDPNAQIINDFCTHAGLFGTCRGVLKTLLEMEKKYGFLKLLSDELDEEQRFVLGFDRATTRESLACNEPHGRIVGHLGFTGTCFWIDLDTHKGFAILSNGTVKHWYNKDNLNKIRRDLGSMLLQM